VQTGSMGYIDVASVGFTLPDGRVLLEEASFRVGEGVKAALVGANGAGKTTLLAMIAGDLRPHRGSISRAGGLAVMHQFIGSVRDTTTVQDLLAQLSSHNVRSAWTTLQAAEIQMMEGDDERTQMSYAYALADWGDAGGYEAEVLWDTVTVAALGTTYERCKYRELATLSGGEQKRLALELLIRGREEVLLLDEPDNYLDVPGKRWLEGRLLETPKTVLFVSHDRELLAAVADRVVTVEGRTAWVHSGGFDSYHAARTHRHDRMAELRRRWDEEHERLRELVRTLQIQAKISEAQAQKYRVQARRLERFEEIGPPPDRPADEKVAIRLRGGRTGVRAVTCRSLGLTGLMQPFTVEIFFGERVAVLGSNGAGKSHFLRLLGGDQVAHTGEWQLGARVVPGLFAQTHAHPEWLKLPLLDLLWKGDDSRPSIPRGAAMSILRRYGLSDQAEQEFSTLSGGQQARLQILLLELSGATLLLLDEPTDNLDVLSAEALEEALDSFEGTVIAVTHDRWFARSFDRYLIFGSHGEVYESPEPIFDETRVARPR
jgi:ATPase subunit of ABC transporter with duplicated ATPase domains